MSPAGGGVGGGPDCPIASTIFSILFPQASLCFPHFLTQVVCKRSQPFVVSVIIGFIGFWFFPHCFRVPFPPPWSPASGGQLPAMFPVDFLPLCVARKARTNRVCPCRQKPLNLTRMPLTPPTRGGGKNVSSPLTSSWAQSNDGGGQVGALNCYQNSNHVCVSEASCMASVNLFLKTAFYLHVLPPMFSTSHLLNLYYMTIPAFLPILLSYTRTCTIHWFW